MRPKSHSLESIYQKVSKVETASLLPKMLFNTDSAYAVIVETEKGPKIVNFCSEDYTLIPNQELFEPLLKTLEKDFKIETFARQYKDSRFHVDFIVKDKSYEITKKDAVHFKIAFQNSYDGRLKLKLQGGLWRIICSNGMGAYRDEGGSAIFMHTTSIGNGSYITQTAKYLERFLGDRKDVLEPFKELAGESVKNLENEVQDVLDMTSFPKSWKDAVLGKYIEEVKTLKLPPTRYVLYNAFNFQLNHNRDLAMEEHAREKIDAEVFDTLYNL